MARPKDWRDAARFRWGMALVLSITFLGAFAFITQMEGGNLSYLALPAPEFAWSGVNRIPGPVLDLAVPWSAGATLWPALPACLVLLAIYISGAQRPIFRLRSHTGQYRAQAQATSLYLSAPLAWLLVGTALTAGGIALGESDYDFLGTKTRLPSLFIFSGWPLIVLSPLVTLWRIAQWTARANHSGYSTGLLGAAELLTRWLVGLVIFLGFFPWCVGFVWIVIDSFR